MTLYLSPETLTDVRTIAETNLLERLHQGGECGCVFDGNDLGAACMEHTVLGLLVPTVEAFETPWSVA